MFIDETGLKTDMARLRGWASADERLVEAVPAAQWQTTTLVQAISLAGTRAAVVLDGPMNSANFVGFCQWQLAPGLFPGDLAVLDNLSSHKAPAAIRAIEQAGAWAIYLPPYSPDLNPTENLFAKLKQVIRSLAPRSLAEIVDATREALLKISPHEVESTFEHCGYVTA